MECIAYIVEANAVSELGIHQGHQMTPRTEGACPILNSGGPRQLGHEKVGNEVANLPQQVQFCRGWNALVVIFHPCRVAGLNRTFQLFFKSCGMAVISVPTDETQEAEEETHDDSETENGQEAAARRNKETTDGADG